MFRIALSTSLMAGVLLLAACTNPATDRRTASNETVTPITLAQVTPPAGYHFASPPALTLVGQTGTPDHPIWEFAPIQVTADTKPQASPQFVSAGSVSALR